MNTASFQFRSSCAHVLRRVIYAAVTASSLAQAQIGGLGGLQDPSPGAALSTSLAIGSRDTSKATFPPVLDNRFLLGPVKDQLTCGSCTVFASHGLLEAAIVREYALSGATPADSSLAEQFTIDCLAEIYPNLCGTGSHIKSVLDQMTLQGATSTKIPYIAYFNKSSGSGYLPQTAACSAWKQQLRLSGIGQYPFAPLVNKKYSVSTLSDVKALITASGAAVAALNWTDREVTNGQQVTTFAPCVNPQNCGGHAVVLVGWDDSKAAFLVRNSWGRFRGADAGHYYVAYSEFENPQSASQFIRRDNGLYVIEGRVAYPINWAPGAPDPNKRTLGVARLGEGAGTVASSTGGISCGASCIAKFAVGQSVTLTATADTGSRFKAWSGSCSTHGLPCHFRFSHAVSLPIGFEQHPALPCPAAAGRSYLHRCV